MTEVWFYAEYPFDMFVVVTYLVCFAAMQMTIMPFEGVWRNAADNFLLINLIVLFQGALFFDYKYRVIDSTEQEKPHIRITRYSQLSMCHLCMQVTQECIKSRPAMNHICLEAGLKNRQM